MNVKRNEAKVAIALCVIVGLASLVLLTLTDALAPAASPDLAAADAATATMFIKFEGVDGESQDRDHKNWCDLLSFSQGQKLSDVDSRLGTLIGSGVVMEDAVVTKQLDKASPKLADAVCKGAHLPKVQIHVTRAFPSGRSVFYAYELKDVLITSYHVSGSAESATLPIEEISLNFDEIKVTYTEYDDAGLKKGNVEYSYKVSTGSRL
jgi:type VI secretion system secreted protein Hcp